MKHTPTPWNNFVGDSKAWVGTRKGARNIAKMLDVKDEQLGAVANAAHIVKCVNAHDELVEALAKLKRVAGIYCMDTDVHVMDKELDVARTLLAKLEAS